MKFLPPFAGLKSGLATRPSPSSCDGVNDIIGGGYDSSVRIRENEISETLSYVVELRISILPDYSPLFRPFAVDHFPVFFPRSRNSNPVFLYVRDEEVKHRPVSIFSHFVDSFQSVEIA